MKLRQFFRWRAIVPLALFLVLLGVGWLLLLDTLVERGVEDAGSYIVGAKVDVESADLRLSEGAVTLRGLAVANPNAPMTNLFEASEIIADLRLAPLLERRVVVETLAVRGVRFGTPRETSGALEHPSPGSGQVAREVSAWANAVHIPSFSLAGLGQVVNVGAIRAESLSTLGAARGIVARADSLDERWAVEIQRLNPQPVRDSAQALVTRLQSADRRQLGVTGVANLVRSARGTLGQIDAVRLGLASLDSAARGEMASVRAGVSALATAREADYAYARSLLRLPGISAPELSPSLFGEAAVGWLQPVLYWLRLAEQYLPAGLDPRRRVGADRQRASGTTVQYPAESRGPRFLLEHADADLVLGGAGAAAGSYVARLSGLTTDPALYGKPLEVFAERSGATRGPRSLNVAAVLDHVRRPLTDSLHVVLEGFDLPSIDVAAIGAHLLPGAGSTRLTLRRLGDSIQGRWLWQTPNATWQRDSAAAGPSSSGIQARAETLVWNTLSGLHNVEIEVGVSGDVRHPRLSVRSNVGDVLAASLRQELGRELERAQAEVRARVDGLVQQQVTEAQARVRQLGESIDSRIAQPRAELQQMQERIRAEINRLTGGLPIPGGDGT